MKKIPTWFFLILAILSAVALVLSAFIILAKWSVPILGLPELDIPKYISDYVWWYLLGSAIIAGSSVKLAVVTGDIKNKKQKA